MNPRILRLLAPTVLVAGLAACGDEAPSASAAAGAASEAAAADEAGRSDAAAPAGSRPVAQTQGRPSAARWYDAARVERGAAVFRENCAVCHGRDAEGAFTWRKRTADGKLLPPPLNGTGHAWHHPFRALGYQIKFGTPAGQGTMPGFEDKLTDEQIVDVIAWFQSHWPDEIYRSWYDIELRSRAQRK